MKQPAVILLLFLALVSCNTGNNKKKPAEKSVQPVGATSIEFDETSYNFGSLTAGEIVVCTFSFTNTGKTGFLIESVETDCGCITASYPKEIVAPGAKGLIEVEFDSSGTYGREYKTIEIHGNSKELKHLAIFAEVKNDLFEIK